MADSSYLNFETDNKKEFGEDSALPYNKIIQLLDEKCKIFKEKLTDSSIKLISSDDLSGDGYSATIHRINITFSDDSEQFYVIKMFSIKNMYSLIENLIETKDSTKKLTETEKDGIIDTISRIHNNECNFYRQFGELEWLPLPKIYHTELMDANYFGAIIMEDLSKKGRLASLACNELTAEHAKEIVDTFAFFHANLLCSSDDAEWRQFSGLPVTDNTFVFLEDMLASVSKADPDFYDVRLKKLEKIFGIDFHLYSERTLIEKHGNFMTDLARCFVSSFDVDVRKSFEDWIIDYYYDKLCKFVVEMGGKVDFSLEKIKKAYNLGKVSECCKICTFSLVFNAKHDIHHKFSEEELNRRCKYFENLSRSFIQECIEILETDAPEWLCSVEENE